MEKNYSPMGTPSTYASSVGQACFSLPDYIFQADGYIAAMVTFCLKSAWVSGHPTRQYPNWLESFLLSDNPNETSRLLLQLRNVYWQPTWLVCSWPLLVFFYFLK